MDTTIRIEKRYKIHKACAKENRRYMINAVAIDTSEADKPVAVATNGHILAAVPIEIAGNLAELESQGDNLPMMPTAAIEDNCKYANSRKSKIDCNGSITVTNGDKRTVYNGPEFQRFLAWRGPNPVIPEFKGAETVKIAINANLLADLSNAIGAGSDSVVLEFDPSKNGAIRVRQNCSGHKALGAIMPCRIVG